MLTGITITSLLSTLADLGILILKIALLFVILRMVSSLLVWIWRTFIVALFEKRAYFYSYQEKGSFYNERRFLGLFRFPRNCRWLINDTLVGYVATKRGKRNENKDSNKIYLKIYGRLVVGQAVQEGGVCNIYLNRPGEEGGSEVVPNPVGYIDKKGRIFKYYATREDWLSDESGDKKLNPPMFIGQCENPNSTKGKVDSTQGELNDDEVLEYIKWTGEDKSTNEGAEENNAEKSNGNAEEETEGSKEDDKSKGTVEVSQRRCFENERGEKVLDGVWYYFRKNHSKRSQVRSRMMTSGPVPDGQVSVSDFLSSKLWRFLNVFPAQWDAKAKAWGYGYCVEGFRNPFSKKNDDITMIERAAAALLLARKEGFARYPDEITDDDIPGPAATALFSFCLYVLLFPLFNLISKGDLMPFLGEYYSVICLVGLYFILWLCIVHPLRQFIRTHHNGFDTLLALMNQNTGVLGWMSMLVVTFFVGAIFTLFRLDYHFLAMMLSGLTAVLVNWSYYHQERWGVKNSEDDSNDEYKQEDEEDGFEVVHHKTDLLLPTRKYTFKADVKFKVDDFKNLRMENPFRRKRSQSYAKEVNEMIQKEWNEGVYSILRGFALNINTYAENHHLNNLEKVMLIMRICQPQNISYWHDWDSEELYKGFDESNEFLSQEKSGFKEYCRFPTETIHDKRGDCDCHSCLCTSLLAACGFTAAFCIDSDHAMSAIKCTDEFKRFKNDKNTISVDGETFILLETASAVPLDEVTHLTENMHRTGKGLVIKLNQF